MYVCMYVYIYIFCMKLQAHRGCVGLTVYHSMSNTKACPSAMSQHSLSVDIQLLQTFPGA